jgi:hypothetical protein
MVGAFWIILAAVGVPAMAGTEVTVCLEDQVGLDRSARVAFEREITRLVGDRGARLVDSPCRQGVVLRFRAEPPLRYRTALGLVFRHGGRILPVLEIYVNPIVRHLDTARAPAVVGRAIARVSAHEIVHYLDQRSDHDPDGLLAEALRPRDLE